jgi:hypothetical protein
MKPSKDISKPARTAKSIIERYGFDRFMYLLRGFEKGVSTKDICKTLGVQPTTVAYWKKQLGKSVTLYIIDPGVVSVINKELK